MPTYAKTREFCMQVYPSLFPYEVDFLHHLFFVNGNGYDWFEGELVERGGRLSTARVLKIRKQDRERLQGWIADYQDRGEEPPARLVEELNSLDSPNWVEFQRRKALAWRYELATDPLYKDGERRPRLMPMGMLQRRLYPMCEYAKILHVPLNVKEDWLAAARYALILAQSATFYTTEGDRRWLQKAQSRLDALFPPI